MGVVYHAVHEDTDQAVALKVLSGSLNDNDHFRLRFEAEIDVLTEFKHPNIVQLYSYGQEEGEMYFAMELVEGKSLRDEQKSGTQFDWKDVLAYTLDICSGLQHAHNRGIIHRDLKPANLVLAPNNIVKVMDFGIAHSKRVLQQPDYDLTMAGGVVGTADFMSPEQAMGQEITIRSDLYSLGCVMFALLTRRPPIVSKNFHQAMENIPKVKPPSIESIVAGVPASLEKVIMRLLEKDPSKRIGSAHALSNRLTEVLDEIRLRAEAQTLEGSIKDQDFDLPSETGDLTLVTEESINAPTSVLGIDSSAKTQNLNAQLTGLETDDELSVAPLDEEKEDQKSTFYTEVDHEAKRRIQPLDDPDKSNGWVIAGIVAAILALMGISGAGIYYTANASPSKEKLLDVIFEKADNPGAARSEIEQFLEAFPGDANTPRLRQLLSQANLGKYRRKLQLKIRLSGESSLSPMESLYLSTTDVDEIDPTARLGKLKSIFQMYAPIENSLEVRERECLEALRAEIERGEKAVEIYQKVSRDSIEKVMNSLAELSSEQNELAINSYQGIVDLYSGKPWAADLVGLAKKKMADLMASSKEKE